MSGVAIVCTLGGHIFVGELDESDEEKVTLRNPSVIRAWGTQRGIGELYSGPTKDTKLDKLPMRAGDRPLRLTRSSVIYEYEVDAGKWLDVLRKE